MPPKTGLDLATLRSLLGKEPTDRAVQAVLAKAGKVKVTRENIVASAAGFEFALEAPEGSKQKVLSLLFLGENAELPAGFERGMPRASLLARMPPPMSSWVLGKGEVPVTARNVYRDTWKQGGFEVAAVYRDNSVGKVTIGLAPGALGGGPLSCDPLHFATRPADAVPDANLTASALLVAWALERHGLPAKHDNARGKQLAARKLTPRRFLIDACGKAPTTLDVAPALGTFLSTYTGNTFHDAGRARAKTAAAIKKLLALERADRCSYDDDYLGTFRGVLDSPFYVPDSWDAVDRIAPIFEARRADFAKTAFRASPDLKLYEKAAKARDACAVTAERAPATRSAGAELGAQLVGLVGRSLKDAAVKAILAGADLPIGKRVDEQANPALGVAYLGAQVTVAGKKALGIAHVSFFAAKQKRYIRGLGAEVAFKGFSGALPHELKLGMARKDVRKRLGTPSSADATSDEWTPSATRRIAADYVRDKLVMVRFGVA